MAALGALGAVSACRGERGHDPERSCTALGSGAGPPPGPPAPIAEPPTPAPRPQHPPSPLLHRSLILPVSLATPIWALWICPLPPSYLSPFSFIYLLISLCIPNLCPLLACFLSRFSSPPMSSLSLGYNYLNLTQKKKKSTPLTAVAPASSSSSGSPAALLRPPAPSRGSWPGPQTHTPPAGNNPGAAMLAGKALPQNPSNKGKAEFQSCATRCSGLGN